MYKLKAQFDRLVCLASIDTPQGKVRVNLGGTDVKSKVPANKYVPEKTVVVKGISQEQIQYLVKNKLAHSEKFQEVATEVVKVEKDANAKNN